MSNSIQLVSGSQRGQASSNASSPTSTWMNRMIVLLAVGVIGVSLLAGSHYVGSLAEKVLRATGAGLSCVGFGGAVLVGLKKPSEVVEIDAASRKAFEDIEKSKKALARFNLFMQEGLPGLAQRQTYQKLEAECRDMIDSGRPERDLKEKLEAWVKELEGKSSYAKHIGRIQSYIADAFDELKPGTVMISGQEERGIDPKKAVLLEQLNFCEKKHVKGLNSKILAANDEKGLLGVSLMISARMSPEGRESWARQKAFYYQKHGLSVPV